jgi:hypothetical protein
MLTTKEDHMLKKLMLGISLVVLGSGFWMPADVHAIYVKWKSVDCTQLVKGGTNLTDNEQAFVCALGLKEISTKCVNKGGNADTSNSQIFAVNGTKFKWTTADNTVKQKNGTTSLDVEITDDDILLMVNEYSYDCQQSGLCQPVDLANGSCPNRNYSFTWAVTRGDVVGISVLRPARGSSQFECTKKFYPATLDPRYATNPDLVDPDHDGQIEECIPIKEPFRSCERSVSGLQFFYADGSQVSGSDFKAARIQECILFRDVNKNPNFSLASVGTYQPDVNHLYAPFDGVSDEGGLWLTNDNFTKGTYYTGTCHQHASETTSGNFQQTGPKLPDYDVVTGKAVAGTGDVQCTGGSQLLDGVYGDGIFP